VQAKKKQEGAIKLTNSNTQDIKQNALHSGLQVAEEWQIWIIHNQATCIHQTTTAGTFSSISHWRFHHLDAPVGIRD
jgi:hypothetical protein